MHELGGRIRDQDLPILCVKEGVDRALYLIKELMILFVNRVIFKKKRIKLT